MNLSRAAFGIGFGAILELGCGSRAPQPTEALCRPSPAFVQANRGLPVSQCFSLFEAYRDDLSCTPTLPVAPLDAYADYFDCLWKDPSKPEAGLALLEVSVLAHVRSPKDVRNDVFQRHPVLSVAFRMALAKTDKDPNPEPGLLDLPLEAGVAFGAYTYFRRSEQEGVRWKTEGLLEYWNAKGRHWTKTADCPTGLIGKCNTFNVAGNDAPDNRTFVLGTDEGTFEIQYDTRNIPDNLSASCDGKAVWSSGCKGTRGLISSGPVRFNCPSGYLNFHVEPNCRRPDRRGTAWKYRIICPK